MMQHSALLSAIPNVVHGFSTRRGGVSEGPFSSLNLGSDPDDPAQHLAENRRRFLAALGGGAALELAQVDQVHGAVVAVADRGGAHGEADALVTSASQVAVGVRTADCAPVLLAALDERGRARAVAAVHAGWRGATAGIVPAAIWKLGGPLDRLRVAIGPAIGLDAFEVGEEVITAARASLGGGEPPLHRPGEGNPHLDLRGLLVAQVLRLGLSAEQIELTGGCTASHPELYFSYRRDRGRTGRHLSAIALVEP